MPLSNEELDRISDDIYQDRRISGSVHCGRCGYNLNSLPHRHRCPECGQEYDAHPLTQTGIFRPEQGDFPYNDIFMSVVGLGGVALFGWGGVAERDPWRIGAASVFAALTLIWVRKTVIQFGRFLRTGSIIRRIRAEEEWED